MHLMSLADSVSTHKSVTKYGMPEQNFLKQKISSESNNCS